VDIGAPELILILIIVLVVFGAGRLPQVFSSLGKGVREFRDAAEGHDNTGTPTAGAPTTPTAAPPATPGAPTAPQDQKPQ
jgi:sec-independent protein translocase protein TatA